MAMTAAKRANATRNLIRRMFVEAGATANMNLNDLRAAIDSLDNSMDLLPNQLTNGQTVLQNLNSRLPEPFQSTATVAQKAMAVALWAMEKGDLLPNG